MKALRSILLGSVGLLLLTFGCVQYPTGQHCESNDDCSGGRVCHESLCLVDDRGGTGESPVDMDGDGHTTETDCDDRNDKVHPDATDIPGDGIDQDCSGDDAVSLENTNSLCSDGLDNDGNGFADCNDEECQNSANVTVCCAAGEGQCGGNCTDVQTNNSHCGACGNSCEAAVAFCDEGQCVCVPGLVLCESQCVDNQNDANHCGMCGVSCADGEVCSAGGCVGDPNPCDDGLRRCDDACVNVLTNRAHCGGCGSECDDGAACIAGSCVAGEPGCGNGLREAEENCDDGNQDNGDACSNDCTWNTTLAPDCRNGDDNSAAMAWINGEGHNGHLYWYCHAVMDDANAANRLTWAQRCQAWGGYLVTLTSESEKEQVLSEAVSMPNSIYFNGGEFSADDGHWIWSTGESAVYDPWTGGLGPPDMTTNCGALSSLGDIHTVERYSCNDRLGAICEFGATE